MSEIVHAKTFVPKPKPVTDVFGINELVITPEPETNVQIPVPIIGVFAAIVTVGFEIQINWLGPAFAVVGAGLTVIVTFETEAAQGGLEIVQAKTFIPKPKPVMDVVGESEFVIAPLPETKVQTPVPITGILEAMVALGTLKHTI